MAPHAMDTILQPPQWPLAFSNFVTWCLMWDPKNRPTSKQAMEHEFFADAVDPLRPKSSSRLLGRKHSDLSFRSKDTAETPTITSKPSWFRRSLIARESAPAVPQHQPEAKVVQPESESLVSRLRPQASKRATWANGSNSNGSAPMPILPSIRPISPLPNAVTAQASSTYATPNEVKHEPKVAEEKSKKIGRQLSVNSHGNHYADVHRQEAERALNANSGLVSPPSGHKESFFSHLRKRARRFSGRHGLASPNGDDVEANAANVPWSNRSSLMVDSAIPEVNHDFSDLDKILQNVRYSLDRAEPENNHRKSSTEVSTNQGSLKRTHSVPRSQGSRSSENLAPNPGPTSNRISRRPIAINQYETPEEADELLDEVLRSAHRAVRRLDQNGQINQSQRNGVSQKDYNRQSLPQIPSNPALHGAYLTPSPSAKRNGVQFNSNAGNSVQPLNITKKRNEHEHVPPHWPTPPYEENDWASSAANSILATGHMYR
jgi:meiosis induction protein kinase IME2/SME1